MHERREQLNRFLVEVFHKVLRMEERYIRDAGFEDLSISEMHVIEAVCRAEREGGAIAKAIAQALQITPGSLSAAVKVLEKKGYLQRRRDEQDRRLVYLSPTVKGMAANQGHDRIHTAMVDDILNTLTPAQADALTQALENVSAFFAIERKDEP